MRRFGRDSTSADVLRGVDLAGKVAVVTGASGGLGAEAARALCAAGARVTVAARSAEKAGAVVDQIRRQTPAAEVDVMEVELADPASVRRFGERWVATGRPLDILMLNAGVAACPLQRTREGWEMQFATNHLGHFLLTAAVSATLRRGARVVVVSSSAHETAPVTFDDVHFDRREYSPWEAYGQSKTANVLFANELDRRLRHRGVRALSLCPGAIQTDLGRHLDAASLRDMRRLLKRSAEWRRQHASPAAPKEGGAKGKFAGMDAKSLAAGAATQLWAATAPELEGVGGVYCADCAVHQAREWATDADAAAQLWRLSEAALGCSFPGSTAKL